jgi:predicted ATPase/class 3 adenylate cyclase
MALARVVSPELVGREAEISVLEDALLAALRGDGGVVIVGGEAGMGKTRLVNDLAARARRLGCVVLSGACSEAELSLPYLPFLEAIGNRLAKENLDELRSRLGSAADELAQLFPQMGRPAAIGGDATTAKLRLFESMLLLLRDAARTRALLLILEDLQWADPATRELLDYGTRRLRLTNVLVLATYRTDEMHRKHALLPTIQGWRRSGQAELIELSPLDSKAMAAMVCAIFEESTITDEFRDFLHERSEGNPFVAEEMLRDAIDRGDIFRSDTGWDRKALGEMRIPRTVRDTILHRLERLSAEEVAVLSAASVIGRSFDLATVAAVTGISTEQVHSAVETCVTFQLLEEDDQGAARYQFRHALTREAVYEDMVVPRRQHLHGRVADVLESRPDSAAVDLAHHLLLAGRFDQAVVMCVAAAEDALRTRAYSDAAALFERAAPHVKDGVERGRLLCRAGDAYWNNTEPGAARRLLEEGVASLEAAGLTHEAARNRLLLGRCYWELLRTDLAREQFNQAREVLESAGPSEALSIAYIRLSGLGIFNEDYETGLEQAQRAAEIAEKAGAGMALAWANGFLALAEIGVGRVTAGFDRLEASYRAAQAGGHWFQAGNAIYNGAYTALHLGLGIEAQKWAERATSSTWSGRANNWPPYVAGLVALYQGRPAEALEQCRVAAQRARDSGHEKMMWRVAVLEAHALAETLRPDEAKAQLPPVSSRVETQDAVYDTAARVRTSLAAADPDGALRDARLIRGSGLALASPVDAVAEAAASDPAWLRSLIEALPIRGEVQASPRLAVARGRMALYEGRFEEAVRELTAADAKFSAEGLLLDKWHAGRALAEAEAGAGDVEGARRRLTEITSEAEASGARLAAKLARETAGKLGLEVEPAMETDHQPDRSDPVAMGERMVSVLFADVRGYTRLSGQTAPADMADRIASLQRWALQEVGRRRGLVDKFAGDAVMATFNVSGQSVDHVLQALQAAIAIIDKAGLAGLPVGAGIAVGPAVVGTLTESANVSVLGEVTNLAARLQAASPAGQVTLSEEAHRRVSAWLEEKGREAERVELELKGFDSPVVAYRVGARVAGLVP